MKICAAYVEALALRAGQQACDGEVHGDARNGDETDHDRVHLGRRGEPPCGLDHDPEPEQGEREPVGLRSEDLHAPEPEGPAAAGGPGGQRGCDEREGQGRSVGQHVAGVRQQRQRVGEDAEDDLDDHERDEQRKRDG